MAIVLTLYCLVLSFPLALHYAIFDTRHVRVPSEVPCPHPRHMNYLWLEERRSGRANGIV